MKTSPEVKKEAYDFIVKQNTAVVATVWQGEPYASTVHIESDENMNLYFLSHRNTSKYLNISSHQRAAVVIGTGPKHISIQARGIVDIVVGQDMEDVLKQFDYLRENKFLENMPIDKMAIFKDRDPVVFKFEPLEMFFMNLDDEAHPLSKGDEYHQIF